MDQSFPDPQRALCGGEEDYRLLFEGHPSPMWVFDNETLRFLAVNEAAIRHYGYSREEFLGMVITEIRSPEEASRLLTHLSELRHWQMASAGVWKHRKKDGTIMDVQISVSRVMFRGRQAWLVLSSEIAL